MNKQQVLDRLCASGILPVFRTDDTRNLLAASRAFYDAGAGCVEYTTTMPNVLPLIAEGRAALPGDLLLGVGTVMDGRGVDAAVEAGARFIASPGTSREMIDACRRLDVVSIVGAMTPTEIMRAVDLGADVIKVFPAVSVGPGFFVNVLGPFPGLHMMAAGGMTLAAIPDYIAAGVEIVAFLANGLEPAAYAAGDCAAITRTAAQWVAAVRARGSGELALRGSTSKRASFSLAETFTSGEADAPVSPPFPLSRLQAAGFLNRPPSRRAVLSSRAHRVPRRRRNARYRLAKACPGRRAVPPFRTAP